MSSDRLKMPPTRDLGFYQRRKHDKWRAVEPPTPPLEAPVADTHAHVHLLPDPLWELERAQANGVRMIGEVMDPSEDEAASVIALLDAALGLGESDNSGDRREPSDQGDRRESENPGDCCEPGEPGDPHNPLNLQVYLSAGVHPHNAKSYTPQLEQQLAKVLEHPAARVLGEIGLDYHYDFSPRDAQRTVFRRQLQLAKQLELPVALHLRNGEDPAADNAHAEAFDILQEEGMPPAGVLLHCCSLAPQNLQPWVEAGCYIAYGGALTFKNGEATREAAHLVPRDRLLLETDSPYMTPEPMRGATCTPAHVIFTAAALADELGAQPGPARKQLLEQIFANSLRFYRGNKGASE